MYFNPSDGKKLNIKSMNLPPFAKSWLNYLIVELNLAQRTVFDYAVSATTFLRWIKAVELNITAEHFKEIDVSDVQIEAVAALNRNDIYEFLSFCATDLNNSASSRACKLAAVRSMYDFLRNKLPGSPIKENPTADISSPKRERPLPKHLTTSEAQKLLAAVSGEAVERDYCIILWFLSCGMRLSELVAIDKSDVKESMLKLYGKGRKERVVHLNKPCLDALEDYMTARSYWHKADDEQALFVSKRTGKRLTGRRVEQIIEDTLAKAGLQGNGYSVHKLRHSTATMLYSQQLGLLEIKELLGHASLKSTEVYTHLQNKTTTNNALEALGDDLVANQKKGVLDHDT